MQTEPSKIADTGYACGEGPLAYRIEPGVNPDWLRYVLFLLGVAIFLSGVALRYMMPMWMAAKFESWLGIEQEHAFACFCIVGYALLHFSWRLSTRVRDIVQTPEWIAFRDRRDNYYELRWRQIKSTLCVMEKGGCKFVRFNGRDGGWFVVPGFAGLSDVLERIEQNTGRKRLVISRTLYELLPVLKSAVLAAVLLIAFGFVSHLPY